MSEYWEDINKETGKGCTVEGMRRNNKRNKETGTGCRVEGMRRNKKSGRTILDYFDSEVNRYTMQKKKRTKNVQYSEHR